MRLPGPQLGQNTGYAFL
ncbi:unnamed protein product [Kuraishia capsulata CBS 1993]|uniref:Uncharacterized protein n=1 Tax=Kuraishia capsulata CBS 1993 TaxID=1382522 RepID=W6MTA0_9ASCO|nr:unnamed protein product [Kuraishia capsulata CBS 1993]